MESVGENNSQVTAAKNLCIGQAAATFHCIDDTNFEECIGGDKFVVEACAVKGLCATRHPPNQNPCIGAALAAKIDGVPPTPPNTVDNSGAGKTGGATNTGGAATGGGSTSGGNTRGGSSTSSSGGGSSTSSSSSGSSTSSSSSGASTGGQCVGGPKFDPAGTKNVGNGVGIQFIGGQCLSAKDCMSGCCAFPCGICSGPGAQFQAGKMGCGFGG
jgi:hypothetical protein